MITPVEIESLYSCYEKYGVANVKGLNCLLDNSIHLENLQFSKEVELSETSHVTDGQCYHTTGSLTKEKPWFKASFEEDAIVGSVDITNLKMIDQEQNVTSTLLAGAKIYIDDKLCATIPNNT